MPRLRLNIGRDDISTTFFALQHPSDLAKLLDISYKELIYYLYRLGPEKYKEFSIRKKNGGNRTIREPITGLKIIQQKLNQVLQCIYKARPSVHGFVLGRSIATNALVHEGQRYILNIDLSDFFPSINFGRVRGMFIAQPYCLPPEVATVLAQIICFENILPQGAPTSPIISNMICSRMDSEMQRIARRRRCIYSRYADDLTFSTSERHFPKALAKIEKTSEETILILGDELIETIEGNGFRINNEKVRLSHRSRRLEVTGLTVNQQVNVDRKYIRNIRAMLHSWEKYGLENAQNEYHQRFNKKDRAPFKEPPSFADVVKGKIDFLAMVRGNNDQIYRKLLEWYARLKPGYELWYPDQVRLNHLKRFEDGIWIIESEDPQDVQNPLKQGTGFLLEGYGLVTCAHVLGQRNYVYRPENDSVIFETQIKNANLDLDLAILDFNAPRSYEFKRTLVPRPRQGDLVTVAGFPEYGPGSTIWVASGTVASFRNRMNHPRIVVTCPIVAGASGSPVLDSYKRVVGVASTGAREMIETAEVSNYGVIPIQCLDELIINTN